MFIFILIFINFYSSGIARAPTVRHYKNEIDLQDCFPPSVESVVVIEPDLSKLRQAIPDGCIEIAPQIFVPDTPAGPSDSHRVVKKAVVLPVRENKQWHDDDEASDETCLETMRHLENTGLCEVKGKIFGRS